MQFVELLIELTNNQDFEGMKVLLDHILDDNITGTAVRFNNYRTLRYSGKANVIQVVKTSWFENPTIH